MLLHSITSISIYQKSILYTLYSFQIERSSFFNLCQIKIWSRIFSTKRGTRRRASRSFIFLFSSRLIAHIYSLKHLCAIYTRARIHAYIHINTGQSWLASQLVNLFWLSVSSLFSPAFISFRYLVPFLFNFLISKFVRRRQNREDAMIFVWTKLGIYIRAEFQLRQHVYIQKMRKTSERFGTFKWI